MNLKQLRKQVVQVSGRYDLVHEDWKDNGMDFFINEAQRMLDRKTEHRKDQGRVFQTVVTDQVYTKVQDCRTVQEVWMFKSDQRTQLTKVSVPALKNYYEYPNSAITSDVPLYYALISLRVVPETDRLTAAELLTLQGQEGISDVITVASPMHYTYTGILWMPPAGSDILTVEIVGKFYSPILSADSSKSYWTEEHPQTLVNAVLYRLALAARNRQEMEDWMTAISDDLDGIDKDTAEEDAQDILQIED